MPSRKTTWLHRSSPQGGAVVLEDPGEPATGTPCHLQQGLLNLISVLTSSVNVKFLTAVHLLCALTLMSTQANAQPENENGLTTTFKGVVTLGTQIRSQSADADAYSNWPSWQVPGTPVGKLQGQTGGSDLNYRPNEAISRVIKGVLDLDVKQGNWGFFLRSSAWKDLVQGTASVPYGNYPNGFTANTPLSDTGFASSAKFSHAEWRDAYVYGHIGLDHGRRLDTRIGRQVLQWGESKLITGGINSAINPSDFASQVRPGAQPFESKLPLGMVHLKLSTTSRWHWEGFVAYEARHAVFPGCGTYFDVFSFIPQGCEFAALSGVSEKAALNSGVYLHRHPDVATSRGGQFGISLGLKSDWMNTDVRLYAMNMHSSMPDLRVTVDSTQAFMNLANPGVRAASAALVYAEDVKLFGTSFNSTLTPSTRMFGELAYRPHQPLPLNGYDLLLGFLRVPNSVLALNKNVLTIPQGGTFDAYDRFAVVTGSLGVSTVFKHMLGAERFHLTGEIGLSRVNHLPDTSVLRYGRPMAYNGAAYTGGGACVDAVPGKTCTSDGYISSLAWGLRLVTSMVYPGAVAGADVTPSLQLASDVKGHAYEGTFSEGRLIIRPGVRFDWRNTYFVEMQHTYFVGGKYNLLIDRDYLSLVAGVRF